MWFQTLSCNRCKKLFGELKTYGWAHDVEILYHAHLHKIRIVEMPVLWTAIEDSKVKVFRDGFNMLIEVMKIVAATKRRYKSNMNATGIMSNSVDYDRHRRA